MEEQNIFEDEIELETIVKTRKRKKKEKPKSDVPSIARAWKVGYSAAQANLPETRNPFADVSSCEFDAWLEGWWSGFYDEPMHIGLSVVN